MHRLILLRHGEAVRQSDSGQDFDRRLAPLGWRESARTGQALADLGLRPDVALVSASARTRETWDALAPSFPEAVTRFEDALYLAEPEVVRRLAEAAGQAAGVVMIVGHNPGLHDLAVAFLAQREAASGAEARLRRGLPTGAAVVFLIDPAGAPAFDGLILPEADD